MKKSKFLSRLLGGDSSFERPFFFFLTLVLVGLYIWALMESVALNSAWKIALFTVLMASHIALYWISPLIFTLPRWLAPLLIAQGLIAFSISRLVMFLGIGFGLYPGLIGLVIGLPVRRIWRVLAVGYFLMLSLVDFLILTETGTVLGWLAWTVPIVTFVTIYVSLYLRQAEARERAQALAGELEVANRQLSEYAARVEDLTIATERQRMARELHDTLSQGLAGLILQMEAIDAHLDGNRSDRARAILRQTMEKARITLKGARRVIDDLRQPGDQSLVEAIQQEVEHFTTSTGIPCVADISIPRVLPEVVAEATTRVITEGLTNIARHAQAKNARMSVALGDTRNELMIEMADDGIGFDPQGVEAGHYGLLGMRERVRLAGGNLEVRSELGKGTELVIRLPLENPVHE